MLKIHIFLVLIAVFHALPEVSGICSCTCPNQSRKSYLIDDRLLMRHARTMVLSPENQAKPSPQIEVETQKSLNLRGVTVFKSPFVERDNSTGKLRGFFVDLLDELSQVGKFNYTLENVIVPSDAPFPDNFPGFLISDVLNNKADFALADSLFKAHNYVRYANFTQPYMVSGFSALVQKSLSDRDNITSFDELMEKTAELTTDPLFRPIIRPISDIQIGTVNSSVTYRLSSLTTDSMGRQVYDRLEKNRDSLVESPEIGVQRAGKQPYAFIQEVVYNELEVNKNCNLTHLPIKPGMPDLEYSLAVRKRYVLLELLNDALKQVKESGKLEEIRRKYFNRKCDSEAVSSNSQPQAGSSQLPVNSTELSGKN